MPTNHAAVAAFPITAAANQTNARNMAVQRMPYVLTDAESAEDLVAVDPSTGTIIQDILCLGRVFHYSSTDSTTAHDGTTCLVSNEGKRYKLAQGTDVFAYSVLNVTETDPPASPTIGDAYLVATGGTGDWSGHDGEVAVYQARGWEFVDFGIGRFLYDEDTDSYYHKKTNGDWTAGFGAQSLSALSVLASNMHSGAGTLRHIVENQTTNTPPGTVTSGAKYIVGSVPTGAWVGHSAELAIGENGAWVLYTPAEGWRIYDKATDTEYVYSGSAWVAASGDILEKITSFTSSGTFNKQARCIFVEVIVTGEGDDGTNGATSSFGSHASAGGGTTGAPGTASNGDVNLTGAIFYAAGPFGTTKGKGVNFGGGCSIKKILGSSLGSSEVVTIGATGAANGFVFIREYYRS